MSFIQSLKRNKLSFYFHRHRHYSKHYRIDHSLTSYQDILEQLIQDGIAVVPNFISLREAQSIYDEVYEPISQVRENRYNGTLPYHYFPDHGLHRLLQIDQIAPSTKVFFESALVNSIAQALVSEKVISYQRMVELRADVGVISGSDYYHFDDWRHRFKAFLYVTDVSEHEAPLAYVIGSHRPGPWRFQKEYEYYRHGKQGSYGNYFLNEVSLLKQKFGFQEMICTAKAGTLILLDTRGIHRGSTLRKNKRVLLANYFDVRELSPKS